VHKSVSYMHVNVICNRVFQVEDNARIFTQVLSVFSGTHERRLYFPTSPLVTPLGYAVGWSMTLLKSLKFIKSQLHKFRSVLSYVGNMWCKYGVD